MTDKERIAELEEVVEDLKQGIHDALDTYCFHLDCQPMQRAIYREPPQRDVEPIYYCRSHKTKTAISMSPALSRAESPAKLVDERDAEALERVAAFCHSQWSGWMKYLFSKCVQVENREYLALPKWAGDRWKRQMNTLYVDLSESEKESDRKEAKGFFVALRESGEAKR